MTKYIAKRVIFYIVALFVLIFILYWLVSPAGLQDYTSGYSQFINSYIPVPMGDRIAIYYNSDDLGLNLYPTYIKPVEGYDFIYSSPFSETKEHIVSRSILGTYKLTFSHFDISDGNISPQDIILPYSPYFHDKFRHFRYSPQSYDLEPFLYSEVLSDIYNVHSSDDIESVTVSLEEKKTRDDGKLGLKVYNYEPFTITDRDKIKDFYDILTNFRQTYNSYYSYELHGKYAVYDFTVNLKSGTTLPIFEYIENQYTGYRIIQQVGERFNIFAPLSEDVRNELIGILGA